MQNLAFSKKWQINEDLMQLYISIPGSNLLWFKIYKIIVILTVIITELLVNTLFLRKGEHGFSDYLSLTLCESDTPIYLHMDVCLAGPSSLGWVPALNPRPFWLPDFLSEMLSSYQNHNEISPHIYHNGHHQKVYK